jgi:hypothetical protein
MLCTRRPILLDLSPVLWSPKTMGVDIFFRHPVDSHCCCRHHYHDPSHPERAASRCAGEWLRVHKVHIAKQLSRVRLCCNHHPGVPERGPDRCQPRAEVQRNANRGLDESVLRSYERCAALHCAPWSECGQESSLPWSCAVAVWCHIRCFPYDICCWFQGRSVDRSRHQGRDDYCLVLLEAEEGGCEVVRRVAFIKFNL